MAQDRGDPLAAAGERARALEQAQAYQAQVRQELEAEPNPAAGRPVAIGVPSLVALDQDTRVQGLAEGLTEELITAAASMPGLRVASRTSLAALSQGSGDVREVGARLGLAAVIEGSVRRASGRVRVTVRLVDTRDGCHLWTGRYELPLEEGFASQDALAREVAEAIRPHLARRRGT